MDGGGREEGEGGGKKGESLLIIWSSVDNDAIHIPVHTLLSSPRPVLSLNMV